MWLMSGSCKTCSSNLSSSRAIITVTILYLTCHYLYSDRNDADDSTPSLTRASRGRSNASFVASFLVSLLVSSAAHCHASAPSDV